jgi:hypothetical protein
VHLWEWQNGILVAVVHTDRVVLEQSEVTALHRVHVDGVLCPEDPLRSFITVLSYGDVVGGRVAHIHIVISGAWGHCNLDIH